MLGVFSLNSVCKIIHKDEHTKCLWREYLYSMNVYNDKKNIKSTG